MNSKDALVMLTTSAVTLFIPHTTNIYRGYAMDAIHKKLAVVFFLACWNSQVETQGQGKEYAHRTILQCAVQNIYV